MNKLQIGLFALIPVIFQLLTGSSFAEPQCDPPVFVECPDTVRACIWDTVSVQVKATHPNSEHAKSIRYHLVAGPGTVNDRTGVWSYFHEVVPGTWTKPFLVEISASIGQSPINTSGDGNCRFEVILGGSTPRSISIDGLKGLGIFRCEAPGSRSVPVDIYDPYNCGVTISIDSVSPQPLGSIAVDENRILTFTAAAGDVNKRFLVWIKAENEGGIGTALAVFDTRVIIPAPIFVECPDSVAVGVFGCGYQIVRLKAIDPEYRDSLGVVYHLVSGEGAVYAREGIWRIRPTEDQIGQTFDIEVAAAYAGVKTSGNQNCRFKATVLATIPPDFSAYATNPCGKELNIPTYRDTSVSIRATTNSGCAPVSYFLSSISPHPSGTVAVLRPDASRYASVLFRLKPEDESKTFAITVGATNRRDTAFCSFSAVAIGLEVAAPIAISVERRGGVRLGSRDTVSVTLDKSPYELGGFSFVLAYDHTLLSFQGAVAGSAFFGEEGCNWEYFTYRPVADSCPPNCTPGIVRVIGIAETNNGDKHPTCFTPGSLPATLFGLDFLVSGDRVMACGFSPIRFYWLDCQSNTMSSKFGTDLYISNHVYSLPAWPVGDEFVDIADPTDAAGYPTYKGAQDADCFPVGQYHAPQRYIDFYNGEVNIACADSIDNRGDVNLNCIPYEIADWMIFANYFIYGLSAFTINVEGQIAATDVNGDGVPLTVADLTMLARIIEGKVAPGTTLLMETDTAWFVQAGNTISIGFTEADSLGDILLVINGSVEPQLPADSSGFMYDFDGQLTRILVTSLRELMDIHGDLLLSFTGHGELVEAQTATYMGRAVISAIDVSTGDDDRSADGLPSRFALHQNYPNPFNASTVIAFDLPHASTVGFEIINVLGEVVFSSSRQYPAGSHQIYWDGTNSLGSPVSTGVYYYRLRAGDTVESKKMVLLK